MIGFFITFFIVISFDWIEMFKEKRKSEIILYIIFVIIIIAFTFITYRNNFNTSISNWLFDIFNIK